VNEELDKAVEKLRLNLGRYDSAKTSVDRIKTKYPPTKEPFRSVLNIEELLEQLSLPTQKVIKCLKAEPSTVNQLLDQISGILRNIEILVEKIAPKGTQET